MFSVQVYVTNFAHHTTSCQFNQVIKLVLYIPKSQQQLIIWTSHLVHKMSADLNIPHHVTQSVLVSKTD